MKEGLISIIMPARNNEITIGVAIESLLNQTYKFFELITVDDYSNDSTGSIIANYAKLDNRLRKAKPLFDDPHRFWGGNNVNAGYSARNRGLELARGEWITFQDADDISLLNRLEIQLELVQYYNALHLTTDCFWLEEDKHFGRKLDWQRFLKEQNPTIIKFDKILRQGRSERGQLHNLPDWLYSAIPLRLKRSKYAMHLFYRKLDTETGYPGAANNPFIHTSLAQQARFRPISTRRWPSSRGRGADRDFNFQLAVKFGKSIYIDIPLYGWRTPTPFESNVDHYLL